jgi:hypothetical protein
MRLQRKTWQEIADYLKSEPIKLETSYKTIQNFFKRFIERERKGKGPPLGFPNDNAQPASAPVQPADRPEPTSSEHAPKSPLKQPTDQPDLSVEPGIKSPWEQKTHN